jgi:hypothetical protein
VSEFLKFAVYWREVDNGFGVQTVVACNGIIVSQSLAARQGLYHTYTGDGNPEWVGQPVKVLRGKKFRPVRSLRYLAELERQYFQGLME